MIPSKKKNLHDNDAQLSTAVDCPLKKQNSSGLWIAICACLNLFLL